MIVRLVRQKIFICKKNLGNTSLVYHKWMFEDEEKEFNFISYENDGEQKIIQLDGREYDKEFGEM